MIFLEKYIIYSTFTIFFINCMAWIFLSKNYQFGIALFLFFTFKFISDISLRLKIPEKVMWENFQLFGYTINNRMLFHANVDPYLGINVLFVIYCFLKKELKQKKYIIGLLLLNICIVSTIQLIMQLNHSFAMTSALIIGVSSYVLAYDIDGFFNKK